jgi:2-C-methyl-D-erythritol 4-phosphate cytidylyltransferase
MTKPIKTSAILLAGGQGTRMQSATPKQFLKVFQKPIACYSFELFLEMPEIDEIIVVCLPEFRNFFTAGPKPVLFALPGERRQDSVFNGLQASSHELICIHDAARPFIDRNLVLRVLKAGQHHGAATTALPVKFTVKESDSDLFVKNTPDRTNIWEIQTPQVLHREIIARGFEYANKNAITVTDDVSLAELINKQVKIVEGSHTNIKVTIPNDLVLAELLLRPSKS